MSKQDKLSKTIGGTALVVSPANAQEVVHELPKQVSKQTLLLVLSNTHDSSVVAKISYNGQVTEVTVQAHDTENYGPFTLWGDAGDGTDITNKKVSVECAVDAVLKVQGTVDD